MDLSSNQDIKTNSLLDDFNNPKNIANKKSDNRHVSFEDVFLIQTKLLTNVDPTEKMDPTIITNLINTTIQTQNTEKQSNSIDQLLSAANILAQSSDLSMTSNFLGKQVFVKGDKIVMENNLASMKFNITEAAENPVLEIFNNNGEIIFTKDINKNSSSFAWRGIEGKELDFYRGLRFRIVEKSDDSKIDITNNKFYGNLIKRVDLTDSGYKLVGTNEKIFNKEDIVSFGYFDNNIDIENKYLNTLINVSNDNAS